MSGTRPFLTLVSDRRRLRGRDLVALAEEAARGGVDCLHVRGKDLPGRALRRLTAKVVVAVRAFRSAS